MDLQLNDKLALVSGSTKGIGLAIATALAAEGCRIIVNGRGEAGVAEAIAKIRAKAPAARLEACAADIPPDMVHYGMTKTAQLSISRGLAETCAGTRVTVNAVLPGPTRSDGLAQAITRRGGDATLVERAEWLMKVGRPTSLLRRLAEPEEVANLIAYVCSPLSSAMNGAALRVDGGIVRACF